MRDWSKKRVPTRSKLTVILYNLKNGIKVLKGSDIFISTWNLHRSVELWGPNAEEFDPARWETTFENKAVEGWAGFQADRISGLYPNEVRGEERSASARRMRCANIGLEEGSSSLRFDLF